MRDNVFLENKKELELADFMNYADGSRGNLGKDIPVTIYRLLEYSIREQLIRQFGKETQIQVFQDAGFRAEIKEVRCSVCKIRTVNFYLSICGVSFMTRRFRRWISQSWTNHTRNWDGDFRYWNGLLRRCWNIPKTFLWEIGKNTEKSEGSFKRGFYHELQLWCGGI